MALPTHPNPLPAITTLTPPPSLAGELPAYSLLDAFKTTGDALSKLRAGIEPDLLAYQAKLTQVMATRAATPSTTRFAVEVEAMIASLTPYRERLLALRGSEVHLETSHAPGEDQPLRVRPVSPKKKAEVELEV